MTYHTLFRVVVLLTLTLTSACERVSAETAEPSHAGHVHDESAQAPDEIAYYTCPMHPSVRAPVPGNCPICGMTLQPVTVEEVRSGVIVVDPERRQLIGVKTAAVGRHPLELSIRTVGKVVYDESRLADVSLKIGGWIGELHVNTLGQFVQKGDVLFTLYSPELYAAQEELLAAATTQRSRGSATGGVDYVMQAARRRLRLWDLQPAQIDQILRAGKPTQYLPIVAPISGYVIEKNLVQGAAVETGVRLYRIADLNQVWIEAELYETDATAVAVGDAARVTLPYRPGWQARGRVGFIYPYLNETTRTVKARVELDNAGLELKPEMYANVELEKMLGEALAIPANAVLYTGERRFVFVDLGEGRLKPKAVEVGRRAGDLVEVRAGLEEGDVIVTSGTFLIAAESRLKVDMEHWQ